MQYAVLGAPKLYFTTLWSKKKEDDCYFVRNMRCSCSIKKLLMNCIFTCIIIYKFLGMHIIYNIVCMLHKNIILFLHTSILYISCGTFLSFIINIIITIIMIIILYSN